MQLDKELLKKGFKIAFRLDDEVNRKILGENNSMSGKFENLIRLKEKIDGQILENSKI